MNAARYTKEKAKINNSSSVLFEILAISFPSFAGYFGKSMLGLLELKFKYGIRV